MRIMKCFKGKLRIMIKFKFIINLISELFCKERDIEIYDYL